MTDEDVIVTVKDMRKAGYCRRGSHLYSEVCGLDWMDFLKNGISASKLRGNGDALAEKVIDIAKQRIATEAKNG